jgi:O-antigen/teichoic acid export membrane protein
MKYLAFIPTSHLILPMTEILIVELRKASIDSSYFTQMFNASLLVALAIAIPASTFISTFHEMTTLMLLGDNWIEYSELFAAFALLITSAAIHQHCSKVLVIFDKPKHLFIYEIATFILVYGTLYLVGLKSLSIFIYVRVGLEQAFSVLFLFYVSLKYTNFRALVSLIFGVAGILLGAYIAAKCADYVVDIPSNLILSFFSVGAIFVLVYVVCLVVLYISFFKKLREWVYIHSLLMRVLNPLIQKIQAM